MSKNMLIRSVSLIHNLIVIERTDLPVATIVVRLRNAVKPEENVRAISTRSIIFVRLNDPMESDVAGHQDSVAMRVAWVDLLI